MPLNLFHRKNNPVRIGTLRRCLNEMLLYSGKGRAFLDVHLVGTSTIARLNKKYLKKTGVTDVLSFPMETKPLSSRAPWHLGDIFIATEIAKRQAMRAGRSLTQQVIRLAIHGLVHLEGWDHERNFREKKRFESLERKYLGHLNRKGCMQWDGSLQF